MLYCLPGTSVSIKRINEDTWECHTYTSKFILKHNVLVESLPADWMADLIKIQKDVCTLNILGLTSEEEWLATWAVQVLDSVMQCPPLHPFAEVSLYLALTNIRELLRKYSTTKTIK